MFKKYYIGRRVQDLENYKGTVKYIGPVVVAKNKDELWLGVEWDNETRGKHDGSVVDDAGNLHRYFECKSLHSGSFVKPTKLSTEKTLLECIVERYCDNENGSYISSSNDESRLVPDAYVSTSKGNQKSIEFVGEQKIRKWQQISKVNKISIRNDKIISIGDISNLASHLIEVDLQDNLLSKWNEVAILGNQLINLESLLLSANPMEKIDIQTVSNLTINTFQKLKVLVLNSCGMTSWMDIQLLEPFLPSIQELYLANNKFPDLPCKSIERDYFNATGIESKSTCQVTGFHQLRVLDFTACQLSEWSQIMIFGYLPQLTDLILDNNPLSNIEQPLDGSFQSLKRFSISGSRIESWDDVNKLNYYTGLQNLRLSNIPLFVGKGASEVRPYVIGRIKSLQTLNGSAISKRERMDSERAYLRSIILEISEMTDVNASTVFPSIIHHPKEGTSSQTHPRNAELKERYEHELLPMGNIKISTSQTIGSELVHITFRNMSFSSNGSLEPIEKKIPRSVTIIKLKLLVKSLFGLEPRLQQLSMRVEKGAVPILLDDDENTLLYYGVVDHAEIFINEDKP